MRYTHCKLFSSLNENLFSFILAVSLEENKFLIPMKVFNYFLSFYELHFGVIPKKSLTNTDTKGFPYVSF